MAAYDSFEGKIPSYGTTGFKFADSNLGEIISQLLPYILGFAGLALFVMLVLGGITLMTAAGDAAKSKDGYGKISASLIGFLIIFISYFVAQIVEVVLGVKIL
jgi:Type IV secretion system pilin